MACFEPARVHVVGAGLAGLAAATRLRAAGATVELHEAAPSAGGRCRSFADPTLGRTIDNGNHLLLSGNRAALAYLERIGAAASLTGPRDAAFDFMDLESGLRWCVRPNSGLLPWWVLRPGRRVAGTRAPDYLALGRLLRPPRDAAVGDLVNRQSPLFRRFVEPLVTAALNTEAAEASALLVAAVLRRTLLRGAAHCRPLIARDSLGASFVDPALRCLREAGVPVHFNHRLRRVLIAEGRIEGLDFGARQVTLGPGDRVVLAVPAAAAESLVPGLDVPTETNAILNIHYRLDRPPNGPSILGLVGGFAEWLFCRGDVVSVTVSAADAHMDSPAPALAARAWQDVARALGHGSRLTVPFRVVKERRATFRQTPEAVRQRPPARTRWSNLVLAGDWTATGLPATIEGAIGSGDHAAALLIAARGAAGEQQGGCRPRALDPVRMSAE